MKRKVSKRDPKESSNLFIKSWPIFHQSFWGQPKNNLMHEKGLRARHEKEPFLHFCRDEIDIFRGQKSEGRWGNLQFPFLSLLHPSPPAPPPLPTTMPPPPKLPHQRSPT